jgi:ATP-dependent DNA helicase PIF1
MANHLLSQNRLNNQQFGIFVDMLDTSTQKLVLLHAGGGTGKTFVTCNIFEELARRSEICRCTCPTRVGALHLPQGQTFYSVFKTWTPSLSAGTAIDEIFKSLGGNQLKMVMVDEVSMLSAQVLVLLDTRLRSMYKHDQTFGGISILLIGDFIQLPIITGRDLWSVMNGTVSGNDGTARELFQQFRVKELTVNI